MKLDVLESHYQAACQIAITRSGLPVKIWRQQAGRVELKRGGWMTLAPVGAADLSGLVDGEGWRVEIEVKSETAPVTDEQLVWEKMIVAGGGVYVRRRYDPTLAPGVNEALALNAALVVEDLRAAINERRARG